MELFLHNLPTDLSEHGLKDQLEPFMARLAIVDYFCDKPRKKRFGNITFLHRSDGERFLEVHGEDDAYHGSSRHPRLRSRLHFMGANVFCKPSNREPQPIALKHLVHAARQRENPSHIIERKEEAISFNLVDSSCGNCVFTGDQLSYVPEVQWPDKGIVRFAKRTIIINLANNHLIRIPLSTVIALVWFGNGSLTLTLSTVPLFFSDASNLEAMMVHLPGLNIGPRLNQTSVFDPVRSRLCSIGSRHAEVVGQSLVYQFNVVPVELFLKVEHLKKLEITVIRYDLAAKSLPLSSVGELLKVLRGELAGYTQDKSLPFEILFHLQALAYNAYLPPLKILDLAKELRRIYRKSKSTGKRPLSVDSVRKLFDLIDWPVPYSNPTDFEVSSIVEALFQNEQEIQDGFAQKEGFLRPDQNLTRIFRVMVTPSRITFHGPEVEPSNRILRRFPNHHEFFARVQFCDEDGQDIHFNPQVNSDNVFSRFRHILRNGLEIAGRTYTFLGFSHSSLRSHSVWFSAPFFDDDGNLQTYFSIIKAVGNFSQITSPARCAARIGQAFSETPFTLNLDENDVLISEIPDVEYENRVFSDGVGAISWNVMEAIWSQIPSSKGSPSCFQIRLGGVKGMLALDSRLAGSIVQIRPSMVKFKSLDMQDLGICDMASKPVPLVLNRQMIKIMEDMGVSDGWFLKLQNARIAQLREATASTRNAAKFLKAQGTGDSIKLHKLFIMCSLLRLDYREEPFLRSIVEAVVFRELRLLKHRARIPVPKGMTLFGIMDETGFLEEGQVYVTFDTKNGKHMSPPGPQWLLVTRSPALFNGDIQYAYNSIPPEGHPLLEHRNCIIFSQRGKRDLPSQLSGGDLDGDLFNIIWDNEAEATRAFQPADYPRVDPLDIKRAVTKDDMADFFIDFMRTDRLGVIATRHIILADQMEEGTCHPDCQKLAQLHSTAVDFSKTGIPVEMDALPRMKNGFRPDFLAPGPQTHLHNRSEIELKLPVLPASYDKDEDSGPMYKYYRSEKILGKLYRAIDERKIWQEDVRYNRVPNARAPWDILIEHLTERCLAIGQIRWTTRVEEARCIRSAYEDAIFSAMNNFSDHPVHPISELEVFIGNILNKSGVQTRRQRERSIKLRDEFARSATWIMGHLRRHGNKVAELTGYETELDSLELCLACVHVGAPRDRSAMMRKRRDWEGELETFRIVAACALLAELGMFESGKKGGSQEKGDKTHAVV